jgi:integrase/recombinase XerD
MDELARLLAEHDDWLTVERGLAPNSLAAYRRDLRRYTQFLVDRGETEPDAIGENTVHDYVRYLESLTDEDSRRLLAPSSVARAIVAVRSFHRFCAREGLLERDPSEEVGAPRVPQGIPKALDEDDVEKLLGAVTGNDPLAQRDRALLELLYATGIRISEAVGLDVDDLDLEDSMVRVLGKGNKERVVPLGSTALAVLDVYVRDGRMALRRDRPRKAGDAAAVMLNARGGRITRQACWQTVRRAPVATCPAPLVRDPHARPRRRPARCPGIARSRQRFDDAGVHQGVAEPPACGVRSGSSAGPVAPEANVR